MRRETVRSLPGMARAESTTVSPGPAATSRCSPTLTIERAESGSPWLPGRRSTTARSPPRPRAWPGERRGASGMRSSPRSSATSALSTMRRPRKATGRRARAREVGHALDARDRRGEAGHEHAAARPLEDVLERGEDRVLAGGEAGLLDVRAVGEEREHAAVAPRRERLDVGALVRRRRARRS